MEEKGLFKEAVINKFSNKKVNFFRLGPKNKWEDNLEKDVQEELSAQWEQWMLLNLLIQNLKKQKAMQISLAR